MTTKKSIRKAGRPENAGMAAETIKNKIEWELSKAHKNAANNLGKYFSQLDEYAMGKGSDQNTVSACNFFIKMAQDYIKENPEDLEEIEQNIEEVQETKKVANGETVLSYADKVALHKQRQAEKKAQEV